jgi:hypothetical protein
MLGKKRTLRSTPSLPAFCVGIARASEADLRPIAPWEEGADGFDPFDDRGRRKRNDARRALMGSIAGVAMLVGPIALANSIIPDKGGDGVSTGDGSSASLVAVRAAEGAAKQADLVQVKSLIARQTTTTTTAPPPTTTTTAPTTTTTTTPPMTAPTVTIQPGSGQLGDPNLDASWDKLAGCESGGNWAINTGNGYYGGLQFSLSTWRGLGGTGLPSDHPREIQIEMGKKLWQTSGWGAWPACTAKFGWR